MNLMRWSSNVSPSMGLLVSEREKPENKLENEITDNPFLPERYRV